MKLFSSTMNLDLYNRNAVIRMISESFDIGKLEPLRIILSHQTSNQIKLSRRDS